MPIAHVLRRSPIHDSFRVQQVLGMFDMPNRTEIVHEWNAALPCEENPWQIGLIVGPSGSGKTTLAKELFPAAHFHAGSNWAADKSILDCFAEGLETKDVITALSSVGISSPPHWLKPFRHLSNGQQFRCELARCLLAGQETVIFDEFTSVVDRDVAKVCCAAVSKTIRQRKAPQLIALSCHFDITDWLQPDWIYDVATNRFEWRRLRRFPQIKITVHETNATAWPIFRGHHYLSADMHRGCTCFVARWDDKPVGFVAVLQQPHAKAKKLRRESRLVVLPDYQGVGIGNRLSEFIGALYTRWGFRYISTSSHPSIIRHRHKSPRWRTTRMPSHQAKESLKQGSASASTGRLTSSFEFVAAD